MGIPVMILGESGSGKTASFRNLNPERCMLFKVTNKPLPFKSSSWGKGISVVTNDYNRISQGIMKAPSLNKDIIIIDDFQYLMAEEFMDRANEKSYQKFVEIAVHAHAVIKTAQNVADNVRVYMTWHTHTDENGIVKPKTIGKLLDEKICIEGLFTIVLRTFKRDNDYFFSTQSNGYDVCKSPMGMFESDLIENDLSKVDQIISDYYGISEVKKTSLKKSKTKSPSQEEHLTEADYQTWMKL